MSKSEEIKARLVQAKQRFWAGDNISAVLQEGDKEELDKMAHATDRIDMLEKYFNT